MAGLSKRQLAEMVCALRKVKIELLEENRDLSKQVRELQRKSYVPYRCKGEPITYKEMYEFRALLDDPRSAWKVISGGKGGAR